MDDSGPTIVNNSSEIKEMPVKSKLISPLGFSVPRLPGITPQDLKIDQIKYYFENPEIKPPDTIRNITKLLHMMKEYEENPPSEESSDIFYATDESIEDIEYDTDEEMDLKDKPENVKRVDIESLYKKSAPFSVKEDGVRSKNMLITKKILENVLIACIDGDELCLALNGMNIKVKVSQDTKEYIIQAINDWQVKYKN